MRPKSPFDRAMLWGGKSMPRWLPWVLMLLIEVAAGLWLVPQISEGNPYNLAGVVLAALTAVAIIVDPRLGLAGVAAMSATPIYVQRLDARIGVLEVLVAIMLLRSMVELGLRGVLGRWRTTDSCFAAIAVALAASAMLKGATPFGWTILGSMAGMVAVYASARVLLREASDVRRTVLFLVAGVAVSSVIGLVQVLSTSVPSWLVPFGQAIPGRASGGASWTSIFGQQAAVAAVLCMGLLTDVALRRRAGILALGVLCVSGLAVSLTRAAWIAGAAGVLAVAWTAGNASVPLSLATVGLVGLSLLSLAAPLLGARFATFSSLASDESGIQRLGLWASALTQLPAVWATGIGYGGVRESLSGFRTFSGFSQTYWHLHNVYLQLWIEGGVLAVTGYVGSLSASAAGLWRSVRSDALSRALLASILVVFITGMFDFTLYDFASAVSVGVLIGAAAALSSARVGDADSG